MPTFTANSPSTKDHPLQRSSIGAVTRAPAGQFCRHYLEMVVAMLAGMGAFAATSATPLDLARGTAGELVAMAAWMTAPMVVWMRYRGHEWRPCAEMTAAMVLPTAGVLASLATGTVTDSHSLLMIEHTVMFPAMLLAMLVRVAEYTGHRR